MPCTDPAFPHGGNKKGGDGEYYTFCYANLDDIDKPDIGPCGDWCATNLHSGDGCGGCCGEIIEHFCDNPRKCYDGRTTRWSSEHSAKKAPCNKADYVMAMDKNQAVYFTPKSVTDGGDVDHCETIVAGKVPGAHNDYFQKVWKEDNGGRTCFPPLPVCSKTSGFGKSTEYPCHCGKTTAATEICHDPDKAICSATNDNDGKCAPPLPVCSNREGLWSDKYRCHCGLTIEAREICDSNEVCVATNDNDGECKVPLPVCSDKDGGQSEKYDCHCGTSIAAKEICSAKKSLCTASNDNDGKCEEQCYHRLHHIANDEGEHIDTIYEPREVCHERCNTEPGCNSITVSPGSNKCSLKKKVLTGAEDQKELTDSFSSYKAKCLPVCSDTAGGVSSEYACHCGKTTNAWEICQDGHKCTATSDTDGECKAPAAVCPASDVSRRRGSKGSTGHCRRRSGSGDLPPGCYCPNYKNLGLDYSKEGDDQQPVINMLDKTHQGAMAADPASKWSKHLGRCTVREGGREYELGNFVNDNLPFDMVIRVCAEKCAGEAAGACTGFDVMVQYGYEEFSQCRIYGRQNNLFLSSDFTWNKDERNDGWPKDVINGADGTTDTFCAAKEP